MSEYLSCVGLERFVVENVGSFQQTHPRLKASTSKENYVRSLHDDINKPACEASFSDVEQIVRRCESKGWVEWTQTATGEFCLCRTELGWQAYGMAADGNTRVLPKMTITTLPNAMTAILEVLQEAKDDPNARLKGDPRIEDGEVSDLYQWVSQLGVPRKLFVEARNECKAEGLIVAAQAWLCELYSITSHGRRWLVANDLNGLHQPVARRKSDVILTETELDVLQSFSQSERTVILQQEIIKSSGYNKHATNDALKKLRSLGYVARPEGTQRKGYAITAEGRAALARYRPHLAEEAPHKP